jgi:hypothetical protein
MFGPWFPGASWTNWRTVLRAVAGLPMTVDERTFFHTIVERDPPARPVKEAWLIAGRGAGKDSVASEIAAFMAATFTPTRLRRGERAVVLCLACDRDQAQIVLRYMQSYRETADGLELNDQCDIVVATNTACGAWACVEWRNGFHMSITAKRILAALLLPKNA